MADNVFTTGSSSGGSGILGMIASIQERKKQQEFAREAEAANAKRDLAIYHAAQDEAQGPVMPGATTTNEARLRAINGQYDAEMDGAYRRIYGTNPQAIMKLDQMRTQRQILGEVNSLYQGLSSVDPQTRLDTAKKMVGYGNQFLTGGRYEPSLDKDGNLVITTYDGNGKVVGTSPLTETMKQEAFKTYLNFRTLQATGDLKASEEIDKAIGDRQNNVRAKDQKDTELALEERKAIETARHNRRIEELYDDKNNIKKPTGLMFAQNEADPTKQWIVGSNGEIIGEKDLKTGQKSLFGYDPKEVKANMAAAKALGIGYGYQEFMGPNGPTAAYVFSVNGKLARTLDEAKQLVAGQTKKPSGGKTEKPVKEPQQEKPKGRPSVSNVASVKTGAIKRTKIEQEDDARVERIRKAIKGAKEAAKTFSFDNIREK